MQNLDNLGLQEIIKILKLRKCAVSAYAHVPRKTKIKIDLWKHVKSRHSGQNSTGVRHVRKK